MQVMRKAWIDEGKPGYIAPGSELVEGILNGESVNSILHKDTAESTQAGHNGQPTRTLVEDEDQIPDDEAMFFASPSKNRFGERATEGGDPDDDELDALMAMQTNSVPTKPAPAQPESEEGDDLDALLAEQDSRADTANAAVALHTGEDEEDDLDALLAEQETLNAPAAATTQPQPTSSSRPSSRDSTSKTRKRHTIFDDSESDGDDDDTRTALGKRQNQCSRSTPPTSPLPTTAPEAEAEPSLPQTAKVTHEPLKDTSQEEIAVTFSSSPLRNSSQKDGYKVYSSSPLPNNPEEEDLDALLGDGM
jgi:hypothetical protein